MSYTTTARGAGVFAFALGLWGCGNTIVLTTDMTKGDVATIRNESITQGSPRGPLLTLPSGGHLEIRELTVTAFTSPSGDHRELDCPSGSCQELSRYVAVAHHGEDGGRFVLRRAGRANERTVPILAAVVGGVAAGVAVVPIVVYGLPRLGPSGSDQPFLWQFEVGALALALSALAVYFGGRWLTTTNLGHLGPAPRHPLTRSRRGDVSSHHRDRLRLRQVPRRHRSLSLSVS